MRDWPGLSALEAKGAASKAMATSAAETIKQAVGDLGDAARSFADRPPEALLAASAFARRNPRALVAGGVLLGVVAGGYLIGSAIRRRRDARKAVAAEPLTPGFELGRDVAHQGESGGLAEFAAEQPTQLHPEPPKTNSRRKPQPASWRGADSAPV